MPTGRVTGTVAKRARRDRETAVQRAERERDRWELVARASRRIAVEHGARLEDLPLGPGEADNSTMDRSHT